MARLLTDMGVPRRNVLVLGLGEPATRFSVLKAFHDHLGRAGPDGTAIFYFSGHGTNVDRNYLLGMDSDPEVDAVDEALILADGWLVDDELGQMIDRLTADRRLIILDSCSSGDATRKGGDGHLIAKRVLFEDIVDLLPEHDRQNMARERVVAPAQETSFVGDRSAALPYVVLTAATESTPAFARNSSGQASVFTGILVKELRSQLRSSPEVTFAELMDHIRPIVVDATRHETYKQEPRAEGSPVNESVGTYFVAGETTRLRGADWRDLPEAAYLRSGLCTLKYRTDPLLAIGVLGEKEWGDVCWEID
jgi:hypothetical protein